MPRTRGGQQVQAVGERSEAHPHGRRARAGRAEWARRRGRRRVRQGCFAVDRGHRRLRRLRRLRVGVRPHRHGGRPRDRERGSGQRSVPDHGPARRGLQPQRGQRTQAESKVPATQRPAQDPAGRAAACAADPGPGNERGSGERHDPHAYPADGHGRGPPPEPFRHRCWHLRRLLRIGVSPVILPQATAEEGAHPGCCLLV